jgi:hypothetical protein
VKALDTSDAAHAAQIECYRRMSGEERVRLAVQMSEDAREITRSGIRARHPDNQPVDVEHALRRLLLGDALFRRAWPAAPLLPA